MTLGNTSLLAGVATLIRVATGFLLNKILAVYVGPAGLAFVGQLQGFVGIAGTVATGGISTGVTKYTAEYWSDEAAQSRIWSAALRITIAATIAIAVACAAASHWLSVALLKSAAYQPVFLAFSATLVCLTLNGLILSILNGRKQVAQYIRINIISGLLGFSITAVLAYEYKLFGALLALVLAPAASITLTWSAVRGADWARRDMFDATWDWIAVRKLAKFALMALTTAATIPLSQMVVREHLGNTFGWQAAGHWYAVTRISDYYLMLITTSLSVYYLPRLSEIESKAELLREVLNASKVILPIAAAGAFLIYQARGWIIEILFTSDFAPMADLMFYQLVGDVLKIASWMLAFIMVAKAMTRWFVVSEVVFGASFAVIAILSTDDLGVRGATFAFMVNYAIYFLFVLWLFARYFRK